MKFKFGVIAAATVMASVLTASAVMTVTYTVDGVAPQQFAGLVTPPADAPWGPNGYPGDTVELQAYTGSLDLTPGT
jgi:hypothetical protein